MVSGIKDWSATPGDNNSPPPAGAPEGMPPSSVNDCIRQNMAEVRKWYEDAIWIDYGYPLSYIDADTIRVSGDRTLIFTAGRRVRAIGTGYTLYGVVTSSSYTSPNTDINITWDTGSLDSSVSSLSASAIAADGKSINSVSIQFGDDTVPNDALDPTLITDVEDAKNSGLPTGAVFAFAGLTAPANSLLCDGASYLRTDHPDLFTAIGVLYGSVDATHFNVPSLKGEFIRGWSTDATVDPDGPRAPGASQQDALQNITGNITNIRPSLSNSVVATGAFTQATGTTSQDSNAGSHATVNIGFDASQSPSARTSTETRPKNIAMFYCIKT